MNLPSNISRLFFDTNIYILGVQNLDSFEAKILTRRFCAIIYHVVRASCSLVVCHTTKIIKPEGSQFKIKCYTRQ